ncbi:MAG: DUF2270 domain-containing protein [Myxococcales bacterium]|nr:DUF2270 domain-containing protein [Myxococcales bacterium]MCB9756693.1 DUF2270 domain-containing protein [Myxococcales bacterium]
MGSNRIDTNTLIHLYRGELGRMTTYRVRLDTTSNWALGASIAITTFALGHQSVPHVLIALPVVLTLVFALLEARRMQDLELIRYRVRLLEQGFFATSLGCPEPTSWVEHLGESLTSPRSPLGLLDALIVRIRRNYIWLFTTLYAAWWLKLSLSGAPVLDAARVGLAPGWLVIAIASAALIVVIGLAARARPLLPG